MHLPDAHSGVRPRVLASAALALFLLAGGVALVPRTHSASAAPNQYVTVDDGVSIAVNVRMPRDYVPGRAYPTVFEMSGYDGGSGDDRTLAKDFGIPGLPHDDSRQLTRMFNDEYVTVHASVRGTGCSSGEFDLFSTRSALDGRYVIDEWIAEQPWSDGRVALIGHSYSGITGFMIAATRPAHLVAVSVSGLIDDLYRGIVYPGGVSNYGFPLLWAGGIRVVYDVGGGFLEGILDAPREDDVEGRQETCAANAAGKGRTVTNDPLVQGLADTDNDWFRARSLVTYAGSLAAPIHVTGAYQDEQTGPRFPNLWEKIAGVPKRLLLTNGDHNTQNPCCSGDAIRADRKAWIDFWMGMAAGPAKAPAKAPAKGRAGAAAPASQSVTVLLETHRDGDNKIVPNGRIDTTAFPLPESSWEDWYLHEGGALDRSAPTGAEAPDRYVSGSPRQAWSYQAGHRAGSPLTTAGGPDELEYRSVPFTSPSVVAGPVTASLWVESTAPDTELFVQLVDEAPDGSRAYLQRGLLKASHRAFDPGRSDWFKGRVARPWRSHTNPTFVTPGQAERYLVEVFPLGHVFRPGHRLVVKIHTPPIADSYYAYVPKRLPGVNTVLHDADHPSFISLPVVPAAGAQLGPALGPCRLEAVRCVGG